MPKHVPANGATLATAVRAAGMSEREACRAAGLSTSAFRQVIVADGIHPSTPIGNVHALITTAGITWLPMVRCVHVANGQTPLMRRCVSTSWLRRLGACTQALPARSL